MSKYDFRSRANVKIRFWMSKYDIRPQCECQNRILGLSANVKIEFWMSKYDIRPQCECHSRILNVKIQSSASV